MTETIDTRFGPDPRALFAARLADVEARIVAACADVGRPRDSVRLLPITKTVPASILRHAHAAGLTDFAENKVQEAYAKIALLADLPVKWSMVGHLQTNKAKQVVEFAHEFHALDSLHLAEQLNRLLARHDRVLDVYIQVNTSGEASKYGLEPDTVGRFVEQLKPFEHLRPRGLMTLAVFSSDAVAVRQCFRVLRATRDAIVRQAPQIRELSMGMSGDYEDAIREGADVVRVGQAIFGPRPTPDGHYWPGTVTKTVATPDASAIVDAALA